MARAYSTNSLLTKHFRLYDFDGEWLESFGKPAVGAIWFIHGRSGNGKTRFALQLCKYMTQFGRVLFDSLEEGFSRTMQLACINVEMDEVGRKFLLLDKEPIDVLIERLHKKKSPEIIVIDSVQYSRMKYEDYIRLRDTFRNKTFIFISHADGKDPRGSTAKSMQYDSDIKIYVDRYMAHVITSRFGGNQEPYIIWEEKVEEYLKNAV